MHIEPMALSTANCAAVEEQSERLSMDALEADLKNWISWVKQRKDAVRRVHGPLLKAPSVRAHLQSHGISEVKRASDSQVAMAIVALLNEVLPESSPEWRDRQLRHLVRLEDDGLGPNERRRKAMDVPGVPDNARSDNEAAFAVWREPVLVRRLTSKVVDHEGGAEAWIDDLKSLRQGSDQTVEGNSGPELIAAAQSRAAPTSSPDDHIKSRRRRRRRWLCAALAVAAVAVLVLVHNVVQPSRRSATPPASTKPHAMTASGSRPIAKAATSTPSQGPQDPGRDAARSGVQQPPQSIKRSSKTLHDSPSGSAPAYAAAASLALQHGQLESARKAISNALEEDPTNAAYRLQESEVYRLLAIDASASTASDLLNTAISDALKGDSPESPQGDVQLARAYIDDALFDSAESKLTSALSNDPENFDAHYEQARLALAKGDVAAALKLAQALTSPAQTTGAAWELLGRIETPRNPVAAIAHLTQAAKLDQGGWYQDYLDLGKAYSEESDEDQALSAYRQALKLSKRNVTAQIGIADAQALAGNTLGGLHTLVNIGSPDDTRVMNEYSYIVCALRQDSKCMNYTNMALAKTTDLKTRASIYTSQAEYAYKTESWGTVIWDASKALDRDPKHYTAYEARAYAYLRSHDIADAQRDWDAALVLAPTLDTYMRRGLFDYSSSQPAKAIQDYSAAVSLAPDLSWTHEELGWFAYDTAGDYSQALQELQAAARLGNSPSIEYEQAWIEVTRNINPADAITKLGILKSSGINPKAPGLSQAASIYDLENTLAGEVSDPQLKWQALAAIATDDQSLPNVLVLGDFLRAQPDCSAIAAQQYQAAIPRYPHEYVLPFNVAQALWKPDSGLTQQSPEARRSVSDALAKLKLYPNGYTPEYRDQDQEQLLEYLGRDRDAIPILWRIAPADRTGARYLHLGHLLDKTNAPPGEVIQAFGDAEADRAALTPYENVILAYDYNRVGDYPQAERRATAAIAQDSTYADAHHQLGAALQNGGRPEDQTKASEELSFQPAAVPGTTTPPSSSESSAGACPFTLTAISTPAPSHAGSGRVRVAHARPRSGRATFGFVAAALGVLAAGALVVRRRTRPRS